MQDIEEHFKSLLQILARLRSPGGCPWDRAQSLESMRSCLLEETWEVLDTINQAENQADFEHLKEELGDLLLNVFLMIDIIDAGNQPLDNKHCVNFNEQHVLREVLAGLCEKLVSRHAHVFGTVGVFGS